MDLDYPSEKKHDLSREVERLDRRFGSIIVSNPKIEAPKKNIPAWIKKKIFHYVKKDNHTYLLHFMDREAINIRDEISGQCLGWNVLHFCSKFNSHKCVTNLLRNIYHEEPKYFGEIINSKTRDGDSPLLIACQFSSNCVIGTLLEAGGVDIYMTNDRKVMAYQIAFSENNEEALKQLMKYEMRIKQKNGINVQFLSKEVEKEGQICCSELVSCLLGLFGIKQNEGKEEKQTETDRKMIKNHENSNEKIPGLPQISWLEPQIVFSKQIPLFSTLSSPFSIKQGSIIISNLLIIFQSLAYYPQLLRHILIKNNTHYQVIFFKDKIKSSMAIEPLFPFFTQTHQPLFLSLNEEIWPMILQKALCQLYNGYFEPGKIPICDILETITSNTAYTIKLNDYRNSKKSFNSVLANFQSQNCIYILKPSEACPFQNQDGRIECFSLLKRIQNSYLVNCPFKCQQTQKRDLLQKKQMKMQKIHYINQSTQPVWITESQFFNFFEQIVFCHTHNPRKFIQNQKINLSGNEKDKIRFYLSVKLNQKKNQQFLSENQVKDRGLEISVGVKSLIEKKENILKFEEAVFIEKCNGWSMKNRRDVDSVTKIERVSCQVFGQAIVPLEQVYSEIFLQIQIDLTSYRESLSQYLSTNIQNSDKNTKQMKDPIQQLLIMTKSSENTEIQLIDSFIGDLQFIECCKNYFNTHLGQFEGPVVQRIGEYIIVLVPTNSDCYIDLENRIEEDDIIEGCLVSGGHKLDLLQFGQIHYAVLLRSNNFSGQQLKIYSNEQVQTAESMIKQAD